MRIVRQTVVAAVIASIASFVAFSMLLLLIRPDYANRRAVVLLAASSSILGALAPTLPIALRSIDRAAVPGPTAAAHVWVSTVRAAFGMILLAATMVVPMRVLTGISFPSFTWRSALSIACFVLPFLAHGAHRVHQLERYEQPSLRAGEQILSRAIGRYERRDGVLVLTTERLIFVGFDRMRLSIGLEAMDRITTTSRLGLIEGFSLCALKMQ